MLILARNIGESVLIGDNVTATVLDINGSQVKIGIDAPKDVQVHREEIYARIQLENGNSHVPTLIKKEPKHGTVAYINDQKGFGFIYAPGVDDNLFFHATNLIDENFAELNEGCEVLFNVGKNHRGKVALEVRIADSITS